MAHTVLGRRSGSIPFKGSTPPRCGHSQFRFAVLLNATIPVSIAALYVILSTFTCLPPSQQGFRAQYDPPHLPYHPYLSIHYLNINLMHFSAHFTGTLYRSALIHHHLLHPGPCASSVRRSLSVVRRSLSVLRRSFRHAQMADSTEMVK